MNMPLQIRDRLVRKPEPISNGAVVINNGGLHSGTLLAIALERGYEVLSVGFDYGNPHKVAAAAKAAAQLKVREHRTLKIELPGYAGPGATSYVPGRTAIFLAYALALAEQHGAPHLFAGVNTVHYGHYVECRPDFIHAFETLGNAATVKASAGAPLNIWAPLMKLARGAMVARGTALGVDYALTHSCYAPAPDGTACGQCAGCLHRKAAFHEAGVADPTRYGG